VTRRDCSRDDERCREGESEQAAALSESDLWMQLERWQRARITHGMLPPPSLVD
jgi:hypothetical protein